MHIEQYFSLNKQIVFKPTQSFRCCWTGINVLNPVCIVSTRVLLPPTKLAVPESLGCLVLLAVNC